MRYFVEEGIYDDDGRDKRSYYIPGSSYNSHGSSSDDNPKTEQEDFDEYVNSLAGSFVGSQKVKKPAPSTHRNRAGYVYLLHAPHDPTLFKIGRASNPDNRLRTFNVKLPFPVEYECVIQTADMYRLEKELHSMFEQKRLDGEWFKLTEYEVEFIKGLAS